MFGGLLISVSYGFRISAAVLLTSAVVVRVKNFTSVYVEFRLLLTKEYASAF